MSLLAVEDLTVAIHGAKVLHGLAMTAEAGEVLGVDTEPARHLPPAHLHRVGRRRGHEPFRLGRVDADEQPALAARGDGHVPADQECEPAEHLLLGEAGRAADAVADAGCEGFVVRHAAMVPPRTPGGGTLVHMNPVERQVDAYNAHDLDAFVACYTDDIVTSDGIMVYHVAEDAIDRAIWPT